jgi:outer membrane protein OmpA-like peptidoglycan-associated protein
VEMRGDGYEPNKPVKLYLLSYGYMGQVLADSNGDFFGYVTMPEGITSGPQTLQANGYNPMREVRSLSLGVQVTGKATSQVATKQVAGVVSFAPGSTKLTKAGQAAVKAVLAKAGNGSVVRVSVVGFGPKTGNTLLAGKRAQAVAAYLKSLGLTATVTADGSGVAKATSRKARQVTITLTTTR